MKREKKDKEIEKKCKERDCEKSCVNERVRGSEREIQIKKDRKIEKGNRY